MTIFAPALRARCTAARMAPYTSRGSLPSTIIPKQRYWWACSAMFSTADSLASGTEMA